jgi:hypothetical protein
MIDFRTALQAKLKTIHARVYSQSAPEDAAFPYLVYDLPNDYDDGESMELAVVDIDGWDTPSDGDTTALETLMAAVNAGLNKQTITSGNATATLYLDTKLSLTDDDPRICRRKYIYQAKLFRKG